MRGCPFPRQALGLGDFLARHVESELAAIDTRLRAAVHGRDIEPFMGEHVVPHDAEPGAVPESW